LTRSSKASHSAPATSCFKREKYAFDLYIYDVFDEYSVTCYDDDDDMLQLLIFGSMHAVFSRKYDEHVKVKQPNLISLTAFKECFSYATGIVTLAYCKDAFYLSHCYTEHKS